MAFAHSKASVFKVDNSGGSLTDITAYTDNVSGLPGAPETNPTTALSDVGERVIRGIENATFTVSGPYDTTASTGLNAIMTGIRTTSVTASFEYGPAGTASGMPRFTGEAWLTEFEITTGVHERVSWTATFQVDGAVTVGTY